MSAAPDARTPPRVSWRTVLRGVASGALAFVLVYVVIPRLADATWSEILHTITSVSPAHLAGMVALLLLSLAGYTWLYTGAVPGLGHRRAFLLNAASTGISNVLPAGGAAGAGTTYVFLKDWGFSRSTAATCLLVTWFWNMLGRTGLPLVGLLVLVATGTARPAGLVTAVAIGTVAAIALVAALVAVLQSPARAAWLARLLGHLVASVVPRARRAGGADTAEEWVLRWRTTLGSVLRSGWLPMLAGIASYLVGFFAVLVVAADAVSLAVGLPELFAAYAVGRLLATIGVTPGGVGVTEAGMVAMLVSLGAPGAVAVSTTLLFSLVTFVGQVPIGAAAWLSWWWRRHAPAAA